MMHKNDQLMGVKEAAKLGGITYETLRKMINAGYVEKHIIDDIPFIYYRELLRGSWEYEKAKKPGGRPRKIGGSKEN